MINRRGQTCASWFGAFSLKCLSLPQKKKKVSKTELHKKKVIVSDKLLSSVQTSQQIRLRNYSRFPLASDPTKLINKKTSPQLCAYAIILTKTGLIKCLICSVFPLLGCTADRKQLCRADGSHGTGDPDAHQTGSNRPVSAERDCAPALRAPPHFMPLPLLHRQRGRVRGRENCLLLPLYLLVNSTASPFLHIHTSSFAQQSNIAIPPLDSLLIPWTTELSTCSIFMMWWTRWLPAGLHTYC